MSDVATIPTSATEEKPARADYSDVAVLVPCLNEELTIAAVVADFKKHLPGARIYVFDNRSTDRTAEVARAAGATVVFSPRRGKGNVVRHMFAAVDATAYVMVDGDDTYPAVAAPELVAAQAQSHADMVVGTRLSQHGEGSFRRFHLFGNRLVARLISRMFKVDVTDVLSGYRVFSRDFAKSVPLIASGFDIEVELTMQAAAKGFLIKEVPISYKERPEGSTSKLNTYRDGMLVLRAIFTVFKDFKPLAFFTSMSAALALASLLAGFAPIKDYYEDHYVYHVPLAILAASLGILAFLTLSIGLILDTVGRYHRENFEFWRMVLKMNDRPGKGPDGRAS
jgi:glycosyltransferase involved in cell wall biosynthesis